jgi:hypothetical protein
VSVMRTARWLQRVIKRSSGRVGMLVQQGAARSCYTTLTAKHRTWQQRKRLTSSSEATRRVFTARARRAGRVCCVEGMAWGSPLCASSHH